MSAEVVAAVRAGIRSAGDPERARQQQAYMKSAMPYRGITSAQLTALLRPILAEHRCRDRADWERSIRSLWDDAEYREERYAATTLAGHRTARGWQDPETLPLYAHLITTGAWWDHVDLVATKLVAPILLAHRREVEPVVRGWITDDDLWLRRTAILGQLPFKEATDRALLSDAIDANLDGSPYGEVFWIRKAIGWALRHYARTDPEWVREFVARREGRLSGLSRREALKHLT